MAECGGHTIQTPADHRPAYRRADQLTEKLLPKLVAGVRLHLAGPLRFRLLQSVEPLIERFEPCVWWKLRDLAGFVFFHASPLLLARGRNPGAGLGTRNMAESVPAKAPPLYERDRR